MTTLSEHREASFGEAYGVLVKELRPPARDVFVIDSEPTIRYVGLDPEVSNEPGYENALAAARGLIS